MILVYIAPLKGCEKALLKLFDERDTLFPRLDLVRRMKGNRQVIEEILKADRESHGRRVFHKDGWPVNV